MDEGLEEYSLWTCMDEGLEEHSLAWPGWVGFGGFVFHCFFFTMLLLMFL